MKPKATEHKQEKNRNQSIHQCIKNALDSYFKDMDNHEPHDLYALILSQVEQPMFKVVLKQTQHNLTRAARILGITRTTLRKKLKKYNLE